jgi:hypothetical protein
VITAPGARLGIALSIGAGAGATLGSIDPPESTGDAASRVALGAVIGGVGSGFILRGSTGLVATGSAMLGALLVGFGLAQLGRGA